MMGGKKSDVRMGNDGGNTAAEAVSPRHFIAACSITSRTPPSAAGAAWTAAVCRAIEQHVFAELQHAFVFVEQHPLAATWCDDSPVDSRAAAAITNAGGITPAFFAQATLAASVMQQQCRQQDSASAHPQGWFSHG